MALIVALGDSTTAGTPGFRSPVEAPPDGAGDVESQFAYWLMQRASGLARAEPRRQRRTQRSDPRAISSATSPTRSRTSRSCSPASTTSIRAAAPSRSSASSKRCTRAARAARIPVVAGDDHSVQHRDADAERAHARGERLDPRRTSPTTPTDVAFCDTRAAVAAAGRCPIGSCPLPTAFIRPRTVTG